MPAAPNHKLGTLTAFAQPAAHRQGAPGHGGCGNGGQPHGAPGQELRRKHGLRELSHDLLCKLQKVPAAKSANI
jgi:DNA polymerase-3 subunit epsilon